MRDGSTCNHVQVLYVELPALAKKKTITKYTAKISNQAFQLDKNPLFESKFPLNQHVRIAQHCHSELGLKMRM